MDKIKSILEELRKPFQPAETRRNYEGHPYVPFYIVLERLNNVLGVENYTMNVLDERTLGTSAAVKLELVINIEGKEFRRTAWGSHVNNRKNATEAEALSSLKNAQSDAFKKACQYLGVPCIINDVAQNQHQQRTQYQQASGGYSNQQPPQTQNNYNNQNYNNTPQNNNFKQTNQNEAKCSDCNYGINDNVIQFSTKKYGRPLCFNCQKKQQ